MLDIQEAVRQWLEETTGLPAVPYPAQARRYPQCVVEVKQVGVVLLQGGRQMEGTYQVRVTLATDRERRDAPELMETVSLALLNGVPMGDRVLRPMDLTAGGDQVVFTLTLCRTVPPRDGELGCGTMEKLHWN